MKNILFYCILVSCFACNNATNSTEELNSDTATVTDKYDSSKDYIHRFTDTALENKITTALLKLPFVIKSNNYIDSFSNHTHGIAFLLDEPTADEPDIAVKAGYNGNQRFETYYRFFVNPKTLEIKVYDPVADSRLSVKDYLKTQQ
ncbi:MAG TPA: hypothetical protein PK987_10910 [Ferruginibacter sp.]|nr:hypothetical protein [Ferruginibacter sp.]